MAAIAEVFMTPPPLTIAMSHKSGPADEWTSYVVEWKNRKGKTVATAWLTEDGKLIFKQGGFTVEIEDIGTKDMGGTVSRRNKDGYSTMMIGG